MAARSSSPQSRFSCGPGVICNAFRALGPTTDTTVVHLGPRGIGLRAQAHTAESNAWLRST